jgi:hypothetical protein
MWTVKFFIIPVTTGATVIVTKGLKKSDNNTRKVCSRFSVKRTAVLGIADIRTVIQPETRSLSDGVHHWFKRRSTRGKET